MSKRINSGNLQALLHHQSMPPQLASLLLFEVDCALTADQYNWLTAAVEGVCGIPKEHRTTKDAPEKAARMLALGALGLLHFWWSEAKRRVQELQLCELDDTARILANWCSYRVTERAKRKADILARPALPAGVTTADKLLPTSKAAA